MKITGTGKVLDADFHDVSWVGVTKNGTAVTIKIANAINMGNIEWTYAEKNDIVPSVTFTSCYTNTDEASSSTDETWEIDIDANAIPSGADGIILGAGKLYIGTNLVALTRGGGSFNVNREYRRINADGDRGAVRGRVVMEGSEAELTMNVLTMLERVTDLYTSIETSV